MQKYKGGSYTMTPSKKGEVALQNLNKRQNPFRIEYIGKKEQ